MKFRPQLLLFALIVITAPLAFGAVDRAVQIALLALFACGVFFSPIEFPRLDTRAREFLLALLAVIFLKEFAPAIFFGSASWRETVTNEFHLALPWTHNPEPGLALDLLLALALGGAWFSWVRTLAGDREIRLRLAWSMFTAGIVLAFACSAMRWLPHGENLIYNIRYTPGWMGYGPFPNRNHTACFLAMSALIGCGCIARAATRGHRGVTAIGVAFIALVLVAMLESKSRGGLAAFAIGSLVFAAIVLAKNRDQKTIVIVASCGFCAAALCLAFGGSVLTRFSAATSDGDIPHNLRWSIWRDTLAMWTHAPLFGFGAGTFTQLFPFYQSLKLQDVMLTNQIVLHPESSWLLALVEMGALLVLAVLVALVVFLRKNLRAAMESERGFFLRASGFAAFAALLAQSLWDVPGHRWGTMGFALAALALACPLSSRTQRISSGKIFALAPLGLATFWSLPFLFALPNCSPTTVQRIILQNSAEPGSVPGAKIDAVLRWFPLHADLHYVRGAREVSRPGGLPLAWQDFNLAARMRPSSWNLPAAAATLTARVSPGMALHFWAMAVERAGARSGEIIGTAWQNTASFPDAQTFWSGFVASHPQLLLPLALRIEDENIARDFFDRWWKTRGSKPSLTRDEIEDFYRAAPRYSTREQFDAWMQQHRELSASDFKKWARLLHQWHDDAAAWDVLTRELKEPALPALAKTDTGERLEERFRADPKDALIAQKYIAHLTATGALNRANEVLFQIVARTNPPAWFIERAAFAHAAEGNFSEAVATLLRQEASGK